MDVTPSWSVTDARLVQLLKQDAGMLVIPLGTVTLARPVHPVNRKLPRDAILAPGKVMDVMPTHPWNALLPIEASVEGNTIDFKADPLNALAPIVWRVLGIVAPITLELFKNAESAIAVTDAGNLSTPKEPV